MKGDEVTHTRTECREGSPNAEKTTFNTHIPSLSLHECLHTLYILFNCCLSTRGGQTAALRTIACGSLSFSNIYMFAFYFLFLLQSVEIL